MPRRLEAPILWAASTNAACFAPNRDRLCRVNAHACRLSSGESWYDSGADEEVWRREGTVMDTISVGEVRTALERGLAASEADALAARIRARVGDAALANGGGQFVDELEVALGDCRAGGADTPGGRRRSGRGLPPPDPTARRDRPLRRHRALGGRQRRPLAFRGRRRAGRRRADRDLPDPPRQSRATGYPEGEPRSRASRGAVRSSPARSATGRSICPRRPPARRR